MSFIKNISPQTVAKTAGFAAGAGLACLTLVEGCERLDDRLDAGVADAPIAAEHVPAPVAPQPAVLLSGPVEVPVTFGDLPKPAAERPTPAPTQIAVIPAQKTAAGANPFEGVYGGPWPSAPLPLERRFESQTPLAVQPAVVLAAPQVIPAKAAKVSDKGEHSGEMSPWPFIIGIPGALLGILYLMFRKPKAAPTDGEAPKAPEGKVSEAKSEAAGEVAKSPLEKLSLSDDLFPVAGLSDEDYSSSWTGVLSWQTMFTSLDSAASSYLQSHFETVQPQGWIRKILAKIFKVPLPERLVIDGIGQVTYRQMIDEAHAKITTLQTQLADKDFAAKLENIAQACDELAKVENELAQIEAATGLALSDHPETRKNLSGIRAALIERLTVEVAELAKKVGDKDYLAKTENASPAWFGLYVSEQALTSLGALADPAPLDENAGPDEKSQFEKRTAALAKLRTEFTVIKAALAVSLNAETAMVRETLRQKDFWEKDGNAEKALQALTQLARKAELVGIPGADSAAEPYVQAEIQTGVREIKNALIGELKRGVEEILKELRAPDYLDKPGNVDEAYERLSDGIRQIEDLEGIGGEKFSVFDALKNEITARVIEIKEVLAAKLATEVASLAKTIGAADHLNVPQNVAEAWQALQTAEERFSALAAVGAGRYALPAAARASVDTPLRGVKVALVKDFVEKLEAFQRGEKTPTLKATKENFPELVQFAAAVVAEIESGAPDFDWKANGAENLKQRVQDLLPGAPLFPAVAATPKMEAPAPKDVKTVKLEDDAEDDLSLPKGAAKRGGGKPAAEAPADKKAETAAPSLVSEVEGYFYAAANVESAEGALMVAKEMTKIISRKGRGKISEAERKNVADLLETLRTTVMMNGKQSDETDFIFDFALASLEELAA